jgi:hypothetical protein
MNLYLDTKNNELYLLFNRSGSGMFNSLISNTALKDDIIRIDIFSRDFIELYSNGKPRKVNVVIRHPLDRFKSGLYISMIPICIDNGFVDESQPIFSVINQQKLQEVYEYVQTTLVSSLETLNIKRNCYHLNNDHTDHCLWAIPVLCDLGIPVNLVHIDTYTDFLLSKFPTCSDEIYNLAPPKWTNKGTELRNEILWKIFNDLIRNNMMLNKDLWDSWMSPEVGLYNLMISNHNITSSATKEAYVSHFVNSDVYWNDPGSTTTARIDLIVSNFESVLDPRIVTRIKYFRKFKDLLSEDVIHV